MDDNKIQITTNGNKRPEWLDNDDKQLLGDVEMTLNCGEPFIPINPETNEPYYHSIFEENDAVWVGQKVIPTNPNTGKPYFETRNDAWDSEYLALCAKHR